MNAVDDRLVAARAGALIWLGHSCSGRSGWMAAMSASAAPASQSSSLSAASSPRPLGRGVLCKPTRLRGGVGTVSQQLLEGVLERANTSGASVLGPTGQHRSNVNPPALRERLDETPVCVVFKVVLYTLPDALGCSLTRACVPPSHVSQPSQRLLCMGVTVRVGAAAGAAREYSSSSSACTAIQPRFTISEVTAESREHNGQRGRPHSHGAKSAGSSQIRTTGARAHWGGRGTPV